MNSYESFKQDLSKLPRLIGKVVFNSLLICVFIYVIYMYGTFAEWFADKVSTKFSTEDILFAVGMVNISFFGYGWYLVRSQKESPYADTLGIKRPGIWLDILYATFVVAGITLVVLSYNI